MSRFDEKYWWRKNPDAPFAELLRAVEGHCHPEAYEEAYDDLIRIVRNPKGGEGARRFKEQLIAALRDPSAIPKDALFRAAEYSDGSDEKFLRRLWRDLYPDEPVPGENAS